MLDLNERKERMSTDIDKRLTRMVEGVAADLTLMESGGVPEDWDDYDSAVAEYPRSIRKGDAVLMTGEPHIVLVPDSGCIIGLWGDSTVVHYLPDSTIDWAREVWGLEESS